MPIAIDPDVAFDYVLKDDRKLPDNHPGKTTFHLLPLKVRKYAQVQDNAISFIPSANIEDGQGRIKSGSTELSILMEGIAGWTNFKKASGEEIEFKKGMLERNLSYLKPAYRTELAEAISQGSELTEDEIKNSESPDISSQED